MGTLLKIVGGMFLGMLALVLLIVWLFIRKASWRFKASSGYENKSGMPSVIHLNEDLEPDWVEEPDIREMVEDLEKLGFVCGRCYTIPEMSDVRVAGLFHSKDGICCALCRHPQVGDWMDMVVQYQDGGELTVTNAPIGHEIDYRPEVKKLFLEGANGQALFAALKRNMESKPLSPVTQDNFRDVFETAYQKDMAWRNQRGGITKEEVRRVARSMGQDFTDDQIESATGEIKHQEIHERHEECLDQLIKETTMSVAQWIGYEEAGEVLFVSESFDPESFADYMAELMDMTDDEAEKVKRLARREDSATKIFKTVNNALSPGLRAEKIGSVSEPVQADAYFVPFRED